MICCCRKRSFACVARAIKPASCRWLRKLLIAGSLSAAGATPLLRQTLCSFLSKPCSRARMTPAAYVHCFATIGRPQESKLLTHTVSGIPLLRIWSAPAFTLPALMQLMGHAQIQTTLVYMQVTPLEVYQQYARAVAQLIRPVRWPGMKLCRHLPVDHPLAFQFQRAVESLTAGQVWDSARQYRGTARDFLIYLCEDHPDVASLSQFAPRPAYPWLVHPSSLFEAGVYISRLMRLRCILEELA